KDGVKVESMAIFSSIFAIAVIGSISSGSVFTQAVYRAGTFIPTTEGAKPFNAFFRFEIPFVGWALVISGILLLGVIAAFLSYQYQNNESAKKAGHILLKAALLTQILAVVFLVSGIKSADNIYPKLQVQLVQNPGQFVSVGKEIASKQQLSAQEFAALTTKQYEQTGRQFFQNNGEKMFLSLNTNPVELAGLLTALAGTLFVILFSFRTEKLRERLPSLESLDGLMYKTACLAFAGLAMLLITGAIWANESWGRPWGFDSKETGALVAWLTYAAFLHTRISRGWKGRSSAYFAIVAFLLVIFTYLGVSYLLPGLHSYA
ncbi:MAG: cytochrome c biogenesis protein CcsA, partial [Actinomycetota bacterium]